MAAVAVKTAMPKISEEIIERGLEKAFLPARFEIISPVPQFPDIPYLIIDGAHTVKSISFLLDTLQDISFDKGALLFGCAADKDVEDMAKELYSTTN